MKGGIQAWVTSAVQDHVVDKAIVLATSLRRVRTAKKMVVFTTCAVSEKLRKRLKEVFDLVVLLEKKTPNGRSLEDFAKIEGFSLMIFNKCVYLSPNALVLKNCDEIFDKYSTFAVLDNDKEVDSSIFVFTPSLEHARALEQILHNVDAAEHGSKGDFSKYFKLWMKNHIVNFDELAQKYNLRIDLLNATTNSMEADITIANFKGLHPLDMPKECCLLKMNQLGSVEKFAVEHCLQIYADVTSSSLDLQGQSLVPKEHFENETIAIVGMSFRLPGGNSPDDFWDLLINGQEAIQVLPPFRWTTDHCIIPCKNRKIEAGFLNVPIDEFDAKFFGISPKEAVFLDPQQRLLHEVSWEALEDAMIDPHTLHGSQTGIYVGSWIHDYKDLAVRSSDVDFFRVYMGNSIASGSARLSHFFGTTGPSIATESGCSSAIAAVHMACKSLRNKESNLALACGVNLLIHPFDVNNLSFVVAPDSRCKTFDAKADGFGRAEACAVLTMKRYSDAMKDGDNIWGLIRGTAVTQEGVSKSLGTPTVYCESLSMELAMKDANVDPAEISYVEAHGTGTPVGDPLEIAAITKAYSSNGRNEPLIIGSVKTNVGHTESVSGITGIIKVLLSMKNETIPPHLNLETLNPDINLNAIPAEIPLSPVPWPRQLKPRLAGVSSFGISGTDGHAIIQEAPIIKHIKIDFKQERPLHIMKISAKCQESLDELLTKYETIFSERVNDSESDFADMAYSANFGRSTFNHRAILVAKNFTEASKIIREKKYKHADVQSTGSQLCFLFTGQGSQYPNMAATLYATSPVFKSNFDKCSEVLKQRFNISINDVLWGKSDNGAELSRTLYSQTSIFCVEYCLIKLWESWGVKPDYVMGHSLGEFAAAVAAQAITFDDALMLVAERSRLIDNLPRGKMLVIKADKKTVDQTISKYKESNPKFWVDYAALNSSDQTVVASDSHLIEDFGKYCEKMSLKTIVLAATQAFHSRHMDPMLKAYRKVTSTVMRPEAKDNAPKYISGMEGKLVDAGDIDADYWVRHTREKVSFIDACKVAQEEGCTLFLEVGPHPVLSALAMMNIDGHSVTCFPSIRRKEDEWTTLLESLSKLYLSEWKGEIDWKAFDKFYGRSRVTVPFYQFNRKSIWVKTHKIFSDIHPLLGRVIPNASGMSLFEQNVTLKKASFAQDHVIGNTIVFPGAAFLEMCLVGGHSCVQGFGDNIQLPRRPIVVREFKIKAPLALLDSQICIIQTVVVLDDKDEEELGYNVNVSRLDETDTAGGGKWISHATAKFLPVARKLPEEIREVDIQSIHESWEKTDNKSFYERLPEVGLRFGPKFQSLQAGWKSDDGVLLQVKVPEDTEPFMVHPVVADAMIQAVMLWSSKDNDKIKKKLQVPVQIGTFIWLEAPISSEQYIYSSSNTDGIIYSLLLNEKGIPLAYMSSIDFAETTVKLVEGMIYQQGIGLPQLWEEIWKPKMGPMQRRHDVLSLDPVEDELRKELEDINNIRDDEVSYYSALCSASNTFILNAFYKLGWNPLSGQEFTVDSLIESLSIQKRFTQYVGFFLKRISKAGILTTLNDMGNLFQVTKKLPAFDQISDILRSLHMPSYTDRTEYRMMYEIGENLDSLLTGKSEVLTYFFPTDPTKPNVEQYYDSLAAHVQPIISVLNNSYLIPSLQRSIKNSKTEEAPIIRILEVGAGTGAFSKKCIATFLEAGLSVEFYYTDISAAFFGPAEKNLEEYMKHIVFKKFNMEDDPFQQGFVPEYFDVIIACEVFHIAKKLNPVLQHLRTLLKSGGTLQFYETTTQCPRNTFLFGLLEGFWQFQDHDLRPDHISLSPEKWENALLSNGFSEVGCFPAYKNVHTFIVARASEYKLDEKELIKYQQPEVSWLIFTDDNLEMAQSLENKLLALNRKVLVAKRPSTEATEELVEIFVKKCIEEASTDVKQIEGIAYLWGLSNETRDQSQISLPLVTLCKNVIMFKKTAKVCVVTQGVTTFNGNEVTNPSLGTLVGLVRAIRNEHISLKISLLDLSPNESLINQVDETFYNLWADNDGLVAFSEGKRFVPKIASYKAPNDYLSIPSGCDRFQLVLPASRLISDLEFSYLEPYVLKEHEVEVQLKATALNFRDVFTVIKPIPLFEEFNSIGLDISGIVSRVGSNVSKFKVGNRVMGVNLYKDLCLPSHILLTDEQVDEIPAELTFMEAATLPAVFSTAVYCLINVTNLKSTDTVLIHTASGGVGLCAIQLAKYVGANVIATAGSIRKRNFLRNLGIQHVFHSRKTDFGKQILEVTDGKGVDVVLNSITGPGFKEASLEALAKNGRFIEMSKLNTWKEEEVAELRPDVFYKVVDLTLLEQKQHKEMATILKRFLDEKSILPIPFERFDALNIRGALNYLQKAKHIGKIVCVMPEMKIENSKLISVTPLFNDESAYLVTGGLGGIGFEVVKWMLDNGAKHVAIASRSSPKSEIANLISRWNKAGKHVEAFSVDVGNYEQCRQLFEELKAPERNFPRLRGIMHVAGVLADATLENQNWETFSQTYNPKVYGTWNLHDLTKDLLLEHFVLFSSIAASFGSPGQSNHSASNSFEDTFCHYRNSIGLPCLSINWGNWGEVGVATEVDLPGLRPISTKQGLLALETLMKIQKVHTFAWNIDSFSMMAKLFPSVKAYVDDQRLLGETKVVMAINSDELWAEIDSAPTREEKVEVFKSFIKSTVKMTLKMEEDEPIDDNTEFQALGIDSLMMLEMKNELQNVLGNRLPLSSAQLKDCSNTDILANRLADILEDKLEADSIPTLEELRALIREDSILPDTIQVSDSIKRKDITEVETVLLTGVTGTLGPYLLRDLTSRPQLKKVYCLIRKSGKRSPLERLEGRLNHVKILDEVNMSKVECIEGDITSATFGLSEEDYNALAESVDAIVHSAVRADHNAKYWKAPESKKQHVRTVNVFGTRHILEFASTSTLKHVYHASTLITVLTASEGRLSEDWEEIGTFDQITVNAGYILSKHISEQLVKQAIERGIPCKAFRLPAIAGESKTGRFDLETNHIALRWLVSMKLGCMPDLVTPLLLVPVDHCSKLSLGVFFDHRALFDVYNICKKDYTCMDQSLIEAAQDFDIKVEPVPIETFMEKLKQENEDSPLAPFKQRYMEEAANLQVNIDILSMGNAAHQFVENCCIFFESRKLLALNPNYENDLEPTLVVMKRDLQYLFELGVFHKFGIKSK